MVYVSFFLLVLLLMIPLLNIIISEVEQHTLHTNEEVLAAGLQRLENELRLITQAADTVYRSSLMRPMRFFRAPLSLPYTYAMIQAKQFFADVTGTLNTPSEVGILYGNGGIQSSGLFHQSPEAFYGVHLRALEADTYAAWYGMLAREGASYTMTPMTIVTGSTRPALVFALSLPLNSTNWQSAAFFAVLDEADILDMLMLPNMRQQASLVLSDERGNVLLSYAEDQIDDYVTVRRTSNTYKLSVEQRIDRAVVRSVLHGFFRLLIVCVCIYVLLGVVLAVLNAYRNAKPIDAMINTANKVSAEAGETLLPAPDAFFSGYQYVSAVLDHAGERFRSHREALENQEMLLCENLFERLLRGEVFSEATYRVAEQYLTDIPARWRMVILQLVDGGELNLPDYSSLRVSMMAVGRARLPAGTSVHFSSNMMVLLLPFEDPQSQALSACAQAMRALRDAMAEEADVETRTAISEPGEGLREMNRVFRQLRRLLRVKGTGERLLLWEEYAHDSPSPYTSKQSTRRFYEFILRGNADMALHQLDEDILLLQRMELAGEADVQQLFFVYRHALSLAAADYPFLERMELPRFTACDTLEAIFEGIRGCCVRMCALIAEHQSVDAECFEHKVLSMIDANLGNPDLYAKLVTTHFGISESSLQRIMRKTTSSSFFEYVEAGRMKRARTLIEETAVPLSEVVGRCGYGSSNSFYKAFRRTYGMSPSAMRNAGRQAQRDA